ncbi:MAG: hypothetical protein U0625_06250 [Phycisphaerales bacterium]
MITTHFRSAVVALCMLLGSLAPLAHAQDGLENINAEILRRIARLEAENADLKARVEMLEIRLGGGSGAPGAGGAPAAGTAPAAPSGVTPAPTMKFFALETQPVDPDLAKRAQTLRDDVAQLQTQAQALESQLGQLYDESSQNSGSSYGGGGGGSSQGTAGQRGALRRQIEAIDDQIARKRAEASKCDHDLAHPPQVMKGWDGKRIVVLTITEQYAGLASSLNPGDFVSWRGTRASLTDTRDTYSTVFQLRRATQPQGYVDPPGGLLPE